MQKFILGFVAAVVLVLTAAASYYTYQGVRYAQDNLHNANVSATYLFGASGVSTKDGHEVTRQQLLDAVLHRVVEQDPNLKFDDGTHSDVQKPAR